MSNWPKLSEALDGPKAPNVCQACGGAESLTRWNECDERDTPTTVVVILCQSCADRIIEPHPRLYRQLHNTTPFPGAMGVCLECKHRDGVGCRSELAQINGGPGLEYEPQGAMVHLCRSPNRLSGWQYIASTPVTKCSGREEK